MAFTFIKSEETQMKNDIYKFYESKLRIFGVLLICAFLMFGGFLATQSIEPYEKHVGYVCFIFFGLCFIMGTSRIFSNKALVEVTPTYIKMYNFEKLLWKDVIGVQNVQIYNAKFLYFDIEDASKYKLTFWQKVNIRFGHSPFYISIVTLSKKDLKELQRIIKQHVRSR